MGQNRGELLPHHPPYPKPLNWHGHALNRFLKITPANSWGSCGGWEGSNIFHLLPLPIRLVPNLNTPSEYASRAFDEVRYPYLVEISSSYVLNEFAVTWHMNFVRTGLLNC